MRANAPAKPTVPAVMIKDPASVLFHPVMANPLVRNVVLLMMTIAMTRATLENALSRARIGAAINAIFPKMTTSAPAVAM